MRAINQLLATLGVALCMGSGAVAQSVTTTCHPLSDGGQTCTTTRRPVRHSQEYLACTHQISVPCGLIGLQGGYGAFLACRERIRQRCAEQYGE